jgi:hypothetical protein
MDEIDHQDWGDRQVQACDVQTDHIAKVVCASCPRRRLSTS